MMMIEVLEPRDVGARQEKKIVGLSSHGLFWRAPHLLLLRCFGGFSFVVGGY